MNFSQFRIESFLLFIYIGNSRLFFDMYYIYSLLLFDIDPLNKIMVPFCTSYFMNYSSSATCVCIRNMYICLIKLLRHVTVLYILLFIIL